MGFLAYKNFLQDHSLIQIPRHTDATVAVVEWVGLVSLRLAVEHDCIFYLVLYATNMEEVQSNEGLFKVSMKLLRTFMYVRAGILARRP